MQWLVGSDKSSISAVFDESNQFDFASAGLGESRPGAIPAFSSTSVVEWVARCNELRLGAWSSTRCRKVHATPRSGDGGC
jgi:hypothetical protein